MKIWIVHPYGNLPGEAWSPYRYTFLAEALAQNGHQVTWWISNYEHRSKSFRAHTPWRDIRVRDGFSIRIVPSTAYLKHISLARIRYERNFMRAVLKRILSQGDAADVVVIGDPALFVSDICCHVAPAAKAKLVVDVIDLWPELLASVLPLPLRRWQRMLLAPLYWRRARFLRQADGFLAVAQDYLALAQQCAPNRPGEVVYWGHDLQEPHSARTARACTAPPGLPVKKSGEIWAIYAGTLGERYDILTILRCAELLDARKLHIRILIAGDGPLRATVDASIREKQIASAIYLGRLDTDVLSQVYRRCDIALSSYSSMSTVSMPIKAYNYMAAGLPVVNSLGRDFGELVIRHRIGLQYKPEVAENLLNAIVALAKDHELRRTAAANALALAPLFDYRIQYPKAVRLIEQVGTSI